MGRKAKPLGSGTAESQESCAFCGATIDDWGSCGCVSFSEINDGVILVWQKYYQELTGREGLPSSDQHGNLFGWIAEHSPSHQTKILDLCFVAGYRLAQGHQRAAADNSTVPDMRDGFIQGLRCCVDDTDVAANVLDRVAALLAAIDEKYFNYYKIEAFSDDWGARADRTDLCQNYPVFSELLRIARAELSGAITEMGVVSDRAWVIIKEAAQARKKRLDGGNRRDASSRK